MKATSWADAGNGTKAVGDFFDQIVKPNKDFGQQIDAMKATLEEAWLRAMCTSGHPDNWRADTKDWAGIANLLAAECERLVQCAVDNCVGAYGNKAGSLKGCIGDAVGDAIAYSMNLAEEEDDE